MKKNIFLTLCFIFVASFLSSGQSKKSIVGIDENLGGQIPLELQFTEDTGKLIQLKEIVNKPTIFMFVFFECKGLCTPLLSEVASQVDKLDLKPGTDYQIVSVSFAPEDNADLAAGKKKNYLNTIKRDFPDSAWKFLTGDSASIAQLTDAVGFRYKKEGDQYIHAGALILVSPKGKITRYLLGTEFLPFDIKMAIIEASEGKATPTIAKVLNFCFSYDAEGKKYALNITRIFGVFMLLCVIGFVIYLTAKPKKNINLKKG